MSEGSPEAPHSAVETDRMLAAVGAEDEADLFDIPESVAFDGSFGIPARSERETVRHVDRLLGRNDDDLAGRSEFLTSYTQYRPGVAQGFLQALFEYQSMLVELTGWTWPTVRRTTPRRPWARRRPWRRVRAVAGEDPDALADALESTAARRIDQVSVARQPRLPWQALKG